MIKNRTAQLIYQTVYCTLGIVGTIASIGVFEDITNLHWYFYVYFTNISNFFCIAVMFVELIQTIRKKEDSYVSALPNLKFIGMLGLVLTFLVFNIMLAGAEGRDPQLNWRVGSLIFHVTFPIMYIIDWLLFYERGKTKWYHPLISVAFPLTYEILIFVQAAVLEFDNTIMIANGSTPLIYPYFFLDLEKQGVAGVLKWSGLLLIFFVALGYLFLGIDRLFQKKKASV